MLPPRGSVWCGAADLLELSTRHITQDLCAFGVVDRASKEVPTVTRKSGRQLGVSACRGGSSEPRHPSRVERPPRGLRFGITHCAVYQAYGELRHVLIKPGIGSGLYAPHLHKW